MKLQTIVPLYPENERIDYQSTLFLLGSCFVENIGGKLKLLSISNPSKPFWHIVPPNSNRKLNNSCNRGKSLFRR